MQSLVSVIIPTFNRAHLISETLNSLIKQTYDNWECILVDDGSADQTKHIVSSYVKQDSRFKYYLRPDNYLSGGNGARNYGFHLSKGEYIQWFDDDDIMLSNYLEFKVREFDNNSDFVICTGKYFKNNIIDDNSILIDVNKNLFYDYILFRSKIFTPSVMFRKKFLKDKSLFNPNILRGQETEFFSRLFFKIKNDQYRIIKIPLFLYRQHLQTKSYLNEEYVSIFKTSEIFVTLENFKRGLLIKDLELIQYFYRAIVNILFRAIENKDYTNINYIFKELIPILNPINKSLAIQLKIIGKCFLILGRSIYRIEMYFKTYKIKSV
ncbi:glycosyltransferase family A protein [Ichthyenterobacterium sp. W332]|uniref:Glycosyltransferase family A protein n=1 Tax=Microcosmobacter mediterraneus TaxID=3075607 RepID=A0ABU2YGR1_9FLAO|nr:glycosyltransferase family A protein [Ichthyenterobacterium sp. W332]MDT0557343.1 glycosyltransferase family A protein [Ichthyenterobacterium sp. W332]